jgi:hypothetical protein
MTLLDVRWPSEAPYPLPRRTLMYQPAFLGPRAVSQAARHARSNESERDAAGQGRDRDRDWQDIRKAHPIPSHPIPCYTVDTIIADDCGLLPTLCCAGPAKPPARLPASPKTKSCPVQYIYRQYLDVPTKSKTISDHQSALSSGTLQSTKGEPTSAIPSHVQAHLGVPSAPSAPFIPSQPVP